MADLIVFGEDWGGLPSSTQHLITHLLQKHRVIWVNSIGMRSPKISWRDCQRLCQKALAMVTGAHKTQEHSSAISPSLIINPKVIPFHGNQIIRKLNKHLLLKDIHKAMQQMNFENPVLWVSLPTAVDMIGSLNETSSIYYCGDDFDALDGVDHSTIKPLEQALANKVDVILVVSKKLAQKFDRQNTIILPHGVDFELFTAPTQKPADLPEGPIAGFYGSISNWLDTDMLAQTATALPSWKFVFIGDIKTDISALTQLPNIHFLGPKPHDQLPSYVQHWNVSMLPFRNNRQIEACNPLKLREYLASGTPIASTAFPAVKEYEEVVSIQSGKEPFFRVILRANQQQQKTMMQKAVAKESWKHRADELDALIKHFTHNQKIAE